MELVLRSKNRAGQSGNALVYALCALALISLFLSAWFAREQDLRVAGDGANEAMRAVAIAAAAQTYITENYSSLQVLPALPVTKNGFTLAAANALQPTVADLNSLGYLTNTSGAASFTAGNYFIQISRVPVGCAGVVCDLFGLVYVDTPLRRLNAGEINGLWISGWLKGSGANGAYSTMGAPGTLNGPGWNWPNPVAGTPAGIVGVRFGFGSSGLAAFAKVTENRNVNFQGDFAVGGNTTLTGPTSINNTLAVTGNITNGCVTTDATGGRIATNCLNTTDLPAGAGVRTSGVVADNVVGVLKAGATGASANYGAYLTSAGDTVATGKAQGNMLVPTGSYAAGTGCATPGALANNSSALGWVACMGGTWMAVATVATAGGTCAPDFSEAVDSTRAKLICYGGQYVAASTLVTISTAGATCTVNGGQGYDSSAGYSQLICRSNPNYTGAPLLWYRLQDLTTFKEYAGGGTYTAGTTITKPTCSAVGNSPRIALIDVQGSQKYSMAKADGSQIGSINVVTVDNGTSWTLIMSDGSTSLSSAVAQVSLFCYSY